MPKANSRKRRHRIAAIQAVLSVIVAFATFSALSAPSGEQIREDQGSSPVQWAATVKPPLLILAQRSKNPTEVIIVGPKFKNKTSSERASPEESKYIELSDANAIRKEMTIPPPAQANLVLRNLKFTPKWIPTELGQPINIYVVVSNVGPVDSVAASSDFRVYLSRAGTVLQKIKASTSGLRGGRSTYAEFHITLPTSPGRYCWEVSLKQLPGGRMTLGGSKTLCAYLKAKPATDLKK